MNTITCSALGVTCWPMNFQRIQPLLGVQTPLWTLVYLLPLCNEVVLQVKTLCLLPSVLDFIPKKKTNGSPSPCPSSSWISSLSFICSRPAQWETFPVSDSKVYKEHKKKENASVAYPISWHRLMPISCNCTILALVLKNKVQEGSFTSSNSSQL